VRIYLDYNATAPPAPGVVEAVARAMAEDFGNASSIHRAGQRAKAVLDDARVALARLVGGSPQDLVLTSGGTEAINLALRGGFEAAAAAGRRRVVTSAIEHEAGLHTARALAALGAEVVVVPALPSGLVDLDAMRAAITQDTALVSLMLANNEIGTIQPVADLSPVCRALGALLHTDAVQAAGKIPVSVDALGVDLLSLSAHKFGGPKGVGGLWIRRGVKLAAQATGGRQERSRRAGTENVAGAAGAGVAAAVAQTNLSHQPAIASLRDQLERTLLAISGTAVNGGTAPRVPNTTNITFEGVEAESLLIALDLEGIAVSTGSACSSGTLEPSHVLRAMGASATRARQAVRFSLGPGTTADEIALVSGRMPALVSRLRQLGRTAEALR
jgi:cysteine desulfurase